MIIDIYEITPMPAPRWGKERFTDRVNRYKTYRDDLRKLRVRLPQRFYHIVFVMPMPKSWSKRKKLKMCYTDHKQRPDKDNLEKAVMDAVLPEDARVSRGYPAKVWGPFGAIVVASQPLFTTEAPTIVQEIMTRIMTRRYGHRGSVLQYSVRR